MKKLLLLGTISLVLCSFLGAGTLHMIITADTQDASIGSSVEKDVQNITNLAQTIAAKTGLKLVMQVFKGENFTEQKLKGAIQGLKPATDDVVFFFNSSHGYRTSTKKTDWPFIYVPKAQEGLDLLWIHDTLAAKKPRLLLVLGDQCNNYIDKSPSPRGFKARGKSGDDTENWKALFLHSSGSILAASSKPGEFSYAFEAGGGFLLAWLKSLDQSVKSSDAPQWKDLMDAATVVQNPGTDYTQSPFYQAFSLKQTAPAVAVVTPPTVNPVTVVPPVVVTQPVVVTPPVVTPPANQKLRSYVLDWGTLKEKPNQQWTLEYAGKTYQLAAYEESDGYVYMQSQRPNNHFCLDTVEDALYLHDQKKDDWLIISYLN